MSIFEFHLILRFDHPGGCPIPKVSQPGRESDSKENLHLIIIIFSTFSHPFCWNAGFKSVRHSAAWHLY